MFLNNADTVSPDRPTYRPSPDTREQHYLLTDGRQLFDVGNPLVVDEVVVLLGVRQGSFSPPAPVTRVTYAGERSIAVTTGTVPGTV